jgi:hypothetical protein
MKYLVVLHPESLPVGIIIRISIDFSRSGGEPSAIPPPGPGGSQRFITFMGCLSIYLSSKELSTMSRRQTGNRHTLPTARDGRGLEDRYLGRCGCPCARDLSEWVNELSVQLSVLR